MEKKRRARINASLNELKTLLVEVLQKEVNSQMMTVCLSSHLVAKFLALTEGCQNGVIKRQDAAKNCACIEAFMHDSMFY